MEKAVLGRYAQLTQDLAFKKVFAAEEDKELLIAMLNLFLSVRIRIGQNYQDFQNFLI
ncbi:MAG: Rpn family recombination-promoting nuclease/putative transposase [Fibromonadaceae bacterium]|jgi:hypothetical protein|nr:Rpn family recombination-promoting nuclease/putative transposase [Fibromonadaceae bacterium]